jgi:hypothetical protein
MERKQFYFSNFKKISGWMMIIALLMLQACKPANREKVVEVVSNAMDFQMPDEIPAGWNTFRYINKSEEVHFILLDKYPEGKTIEDGKKEVIPVFQNGMYLLNDGKTDEGMAEFGKLPAWFSDIVYTGGSGLISPGRTTEFMVKLEPGYYVMECYVKMPNGVFHASMGMTKAFTVTDENSEQLPSVQDVYMSISSREGIVFADSIKKGRNMFAVYFKDQKAHENFVGHDVNLVLLDDNADLEVLEKWMNWADPKGLISPAPAGVTFLGGINEMPEGHTGYFIADLKPGQYAFISEVPNSSTKGLLKTFRITD